MKTIVFIGSQKSGSSREAIKTAANLGFYTVLFTNIIKQYNQRTDYPDVHLVKLCNIENFNEMKIIIESLQTRWLKIKAITSFSDAGCYIANKLAEEFGINHFTVNAIFKTENKIKSRNAIINTEHCPKYLIIDPSKEYMETEIIDYLPAILKSPTSAGSRDVYKILDYHNFIEKLNLLRKRFPSQKLILEE
jgi:5-formaminoimidazole-4-carboxamide-1-beta-D-ribofuranosyl 5'-monophosphate synthetase